MAKNGAEKSLKIALVLTIVFFGVEVAGSIISKSLSLLGDSWHMFRDALSLFLSLSAVKIAQSLPTKRKTFGYHRLEILAAFLNGLLLLAVSAWILREAYRRISSPAAIDSLTMLIVASAGLAINILVAFKLHGSHDLNIRSAFLHVLADAISSGSVVIASLLILATGNAIFDPLIGAGLAVFIAVSAVQILRESVAVLLEFTPREIDFDKVIREIEEVKGVAGVHNVHLWTLCSNINIIDAHIYTNEMDMTKVELMKAEIKSRLEKYRIRHATLEFECELCVLPDQVKDIRH
jgi:cobalt-zinc-cadmium efflux system protein